jgi:hypothetical protein
LGGTGSQSPTGAGATAMAKMAMLHTIGCSDCDGLQISFSSNHPGVTQIGLADGSVQTIEEEINLDVWEAMGTRSSRYVMLKLY